MPSEEIMRRLEAGGRFWVSSSDFKTLTLVANLDPWMHVLSHDVDTVNMLFQVSMYDSRADAAPSIDEGQARAPMDLHRDPETNILRDMAPQPPEQMFVIPIQPLEDI